MKTWSSSVTKKGIEGTPEAMRRKGEEWGCLFGRQTKRGVKKIV